MFRILELEALEVQVKEKIELARKVSHTSGKYENVVFYLSPNLHSVLRHVDKLIVLDIDLLFTGDIQQLHDQFLLFKDQQIVGLAVEQQPVYYHVLSSYRNENPATTFGLSAVDGGFPGFNSGVMLLHLQQIRSSAIYSSVLENDSILTNLVAKYKFRGHLGEQDFYTLICAEFPQLFHHLSCGFNRQLCKWWYKNGYAHLEDKYFQCKEPILIYHGNCATNILEDIKAEQGSL